MKKLNIFSNIPLELKEELFEEIVSKNGLKIERIVSKGHKTTEFEWYDQEDNEWVVLLKGEAILEFENDENIILKEGDYINILAHKKHRVTWTKPDEESVWLAIYY
nr:cupin domain-containing protein [uncultured Sulfurimonas sp.]